MNLSVKQKMSGDSLSVRNSLKSQRKREMENRRLTNDTNTGYVQPVKKIVNGEQVYLFDDDYITHKLENYHIRKGVNSARWTMLKQSYRNQGIKYLCMRRLEVEAG